jgi:DnaK suppressor protein
MTMAASKKPIKAAKPAKKKAAVKPPPKPPAKPPVKLPAKPLAKPIAKPAAAARPAAKPTVKAAVKATAKKPAPPRRNAGGDGNGRAGVVEGLAKRLDEHRREILHLYRHDLDVGLDAFRDGDDEIDRANFDSDRDLALSLSDTEREVLLQIEEALHRVAAGDYGSCTSCAKPIAVERLHAIPWARYCIDCQELEEKGLLG